MPQTATPEARLQKLDANLEDLKERVLKDIEDLKDADDAGVIDTTYGERFEETFDRLIALNDELHPEDFDLEALDEIRNLIIRWVQDRDRLDHADAGLLDRVDAFLVKAEAIRHVIRDALDAHVAGVEEDPERVMKTLQDWLPNISQVELAELADVHPRTILRWRQGIGKPNRRLQVVARLIAILRRGWSEDGVIAWFYRPRRDLGGKRPIELLGDPAHDRALGAAARQGRAQHGS
jgi:hypothetical protein